MGEKEDSLTRHLLLGSLDISPQIDKICTWMLAGTGAAVILIITNIENINKVVSGSSISLILATLSISALFGFASKLNSLKSQNIKIMFQCLFAAQEQYPDTDVEVALENYISSFPKWAQGPVRKGAKNGRKDALHGFKVAHRVVIYQSLYASIQGGLIILSIVLSSIYAK